MSLPYTLGSHGPEIVYWQSWFIRNYVAYAPSKDGYFGDAEVAAVKEMQGRVGLPQTGVFDQALASNRAYVAPPADWRPIGFSVEGHQSDMDSGPVSDTFTQLEAEGKCWHQPIGYNSNALPFDNQSGIRELARLVGATVLDDGRPFPIGTPWALGGFSQGGIVASYFYFDYLAPGKPLNWRLPDLVGFLAYGNPCRQTDSIAPWAQSWVTAKGTHGLDPYRRFGLPGYPAKPDNMVDVYREGDIFAENADDEASQIKAAVYEAVMNDWTSNPYSIAAKLMLTIQKPLPELVAEIQAAISGIQFLASNPNAHYSPFDESGGIAWMRERLTW